jgi:hypothetical protein
MVGGLTGLRFCGSEILRQNGTMVTSGGQEMVRVVFRLDRDEDGWPPAATERLWATPVGKGMARIDNVPFFVRNLAWGDIVQTVDGPNGALWASARISWSGRCTIRVIPFSKGPLEGSREAVLDAFAPLGVGGEGIEQYGIVALDVPSDVDLAAVVRLLRQGARDGWWDYEEGCVGEDWLAIKP